MIRAAARITIQAGVLVSLLVLFAGDKSAQQPKQTPKLVTVLDDLARAVPQVRSAAGFKGTESPSRSRTRRRIIQARVPVSARIP